MLVFRAVVIKCHKPGGLKEQKFVFQQFWRPEIKNQDA